MSDCWKNQPEKRTLKEHRTVLSSFVSFAVRLFAVCCAIMLPRDGAEKTIHTHSLRPIRLPPTADAMHQARVRSRFHLCPKAKNGISSNLLFLLIN